MSDIYIYILVISLSVSGMSAWMRGSQIKINVCSI